MNKLLAYAKVLSFTKETPEGTLIHWHVKDPSPSRDEGMARGAAMFNEIFVLAEVNPLATFQNLVKTIDGITQASAHDTWEAKGFIRAMACVAIKGAELGCTPYDDAISSAPPLEILTTYIVKKNISFVNKSA